MKKIQIALTIIGCLMSIFPECGFAASLPADGFSAPVGLLFDAEGTLYVSEWGAGAVTRLDSSGTREKVFSGTGSPAGLAKDGGGNMYVAGYGDGNIYIWDGKSAPRVLAGGFRQPAGLLPTKNGTLLVANRGAGTVEEVDREGNRKIISKGHTLPVGIAITEAGSMYVSCYGGTLDRVEPNGSIQKIKSGLQTPGVGILPAGRDSVFVVDNGAGTVVEAGPNGVVRTLMRDLPGPVGLARMPDGNLAVAAWGDGKIQIVKEQNDEI